VCGGKQHGGRVCAATARVQARCRGQPPPGAGVRDGSGIAEQALEAFDVDHDLMSAARGHARRHHPGDVEQGTVTVS